MQILKFWDKYFGIGVFLQAYIISLYNRMAIILCRLCRILHVFIILLSLK